MWNEPSPEPGDQPRVPAEEGRVEDDRILDRRAEQVAAEAERRKLTAEATGSRVSASWTRAGINIQLVLAAWLAFGPMILQYQIQEQQSHTVLRNAGLAIVLAVTALWMRQVGRNRVLMAVPFLVGLVLVLLAATTTYGEPKGAWSDAVTGAFVLVAAAMTTTGDDDSDEPSSG